MIRLVAALLAVSCLAEPAFAKRQVGTKGTRFGERPSKDYQSSQWFAFELKFTPYTPNIDASPGLNGATPFKDLFVPKNEHGMVDRPPWKVLTQLEFDFQFFSRYGTLAVGATAGFYRRTTHTFEYPDMMDTSSCVAGPNGNCVRSGDETALNILPLSALLVYRFDVLALRYRVPLVPYLKLGLAYYIWWINDGSGGIASVRDADPNTPGNQTVDGYGGTFGWVLQPGLAFLLDVIDPGAARVIDAELGINHTYLFCEMHYADISNFGVGSRMNLSDLTFSAGIAFEF